MRQELIDLVLGELAESEASVLRARLAGDAQLARELAEIEALFGLMRRGEEIEAPADLRAALVDEAARVRPPFAQRLAQVAGLVAYRFRISLRFRVAMVSLCAHLLLMALLFHLFQVEEGAGTTDVAVAFHEGEAPVQAPASGFAGRLLQRRLPHEIRLRQIGTDGQAEAIARGLDRLLARQARDGSFGSAEETAYAALALLAEGDCSVQDTRRGRAIRSALRNLKGELRKGAVHGAILAALVEDYTLAYDDLGDAERGEYVRWIRLLTLAVKEDDVSREALALASLAGFPIPARDLGDAALLLGGDRARLLGGEATRLKATIVLAKGHLGADQERVRAWAEGLFRRAVAEAQAGRAEGLVLLTLQAPYRL